MMKNFYIGVNSDGSCIISKMRLKRFFDFETNRNDVFSFNDTKQPPHWIIDYDGFDVPKTGHVPIDVYLTLPEGSIGKLFGLEMTWKDDYKEIEL